VGGQQRQQQQAEAADGVFCEGHLGFSLAEPLWAALHQ
jgi:hypothetical protein